ncbi:MAG: DUF916 domain-containing protein [Sporolactobacillus sp.]
MWFKKIVFGLIVLLSLVVASGFGAGHAFAAESSGMSYGATPAGTHAYRGYFAIDDVSAGQTFRLPVQIRNLSNRTITVQMRTQDSMTSTSGIVQYSDFEKGNYARLLQSKMDFRKYAKVSPKSVTLTGRAVKTIMVTVRAPKVSGTLLGGMTFFSPADVKRQSVKRGAAVYAVTERTIPVELNYRKKEKMHVAMKAPQILNTPSGAYLMMNLKNTNATITTPIHMIYKVTQGVHKIFAGKSTHVKMAPTSEIYYPVKWTGAFKAGKYQVDATVKTPNQTLHKRFHFTIGNSDFSYKQPKKTLYQKQIIPFWLWIIMVLGAVIDVLLYLYDRRIKRVDNEKDGEGTDR